MNSGEDYMAMRSSIAHPWRRRPVLGAALHLLGSLLLIASLGFFIQIIMTISIMVKNSYPIQYLWLTPLHAAAFLCTAIYGGKIARRGKLLRLTPAEMIVANDSRPPIVYLRSFRDDGKIFEAEISKAMKRFGPFLAIGRPGEQFTGPGASRFYFGDDEWQERVGTLLEVAQAVVFVVGDTPGLRWELRRIAELIEPECLLIFLPYLKKSRGVDPQKQYEAFREWAGGCLPSGLPERIGNSLFIVFDRDWQPIALRRKRIGFLHGLLRPDMAEVPGAVRAIVQTIHKDPTFLDHSKPRAFRDFRDPAKYIPPMGCLGPLILLPPLIISDEFKIPILWIVMAEVGCLVAFLALVKLVDRRRHRAARTSCPSPRTRQADAGVRNCTDD